jgi:hypothetical protein
MMMMIDAHPHTGLEQMGWSKLDLGGAPGL